MSSSGLGFTGPQDDDDDYVGGVHVFESDTDRCKCGGEVVFFEDPDDDGYRGLGCEVGGVWEHIRQEHDERQRERESDAQCGVDGSSIADMNVSVTTFRI